MTTTFIIPDVHVPFHDKGAWNLVLKAIRELQPDRVVTLGDFMDAYSVSSFPKTPERREGLGSEIKAGNVELDRLGEAAGDAKVVFLEGNHCFRLQRYLAEKAPELFDLVEISALLNIKKRGWTFVPYRNHITFGKVAYSHDIGFSGKNAVAQNLDSFGGNIVTGHTHRAGIVYDGTVLGEHRVAMSCGWLGDFAAVDYMHQSKTRSWQHGVGWCRQDRAGNAWLSFAPIVHNRLCIEGNWIGRNHQK